MKRNRTFQRLLSCFLLTAIIINMAACSSLILNVQAVDLTKGINAQSVSGKTADEKFIGSTANFSIELFKKSIDKKQNSLISPLSVLLALSMTANGAGGETLSQMEKLLGGGISIDELNKYLYSYAGSLPNNNDSKLTISNSIWFRNDLEVKKDFLQKNEDYYKASAYKSAFDERTVKDINNWVKNNTNGEIEQIVDSIDSTTLMYLINTVVFDAEWSVEYDAEEINEDTFTTIDGTVQNVEFMNSSWASNYIDDGKATGFLKQYSEGKFSFVALLPNEGININDYIASMTGEGFLNSIKNSGNSYNYNVYTSIPKFSYEYSILMNDALKALGIPDAFSGGADFSKLASSSLGNIYIEEVLHKTYITVDELGTKAGATTKVEMNELDSEPYAEKIVVLDRPFVYAIIDNATNLPIFIGTVLEISD